MPGYLFVCGCPRSGTTALWELLKEHEQIALGLERYVLFMENGTSLSPELFEPSRFYDLRHDDTFLADLRAQPTAAALQSARWVGDKIPNLYRDFGGLERNFAGREVRVIVIVRNIIDVAASYQRRAADAGDVTWSKQLDYRRAVLDWGNSLRATLNFIAMPGRRTSVMVASYEDLFYREGSAEPIFQYLDLEMTERAREFHAGLLRRSLQLEDSRRGLTSTQTREVLLSAPIELYRRLSNLRRPAQT